ERERERERERIPGLLHMQLREQMDLRAIKYKAEKNPLFFPQCICKSINIVSLFASLSLSLFLSLSLSLSVSLLCLSLPLPLSSSLSLSPSLPFFLTLFLSGEALATYGVMKRFSSSS